MKEEAPSRKLPPKSGTAISAATNTPTKVGNDEIMNAMLRFNNFDSISRESLDIDLSACVTISADPAAIMMSGNSLSSTDFWRMLDESAQNPQLDINSCIDDSAMLREEHMQAVGAVKEEQACSFSGTFLRPEPPTSLSLFSPLKKNYKALPPAVEKTQQRKLKMTTNLSMFENKKPKLTPSIIKSEPPEQLLADSNESDTNNSSSMGGADIKTISTATSSFRLFKLPLAATIATAIAPASQPSKETKTNEKLCTKLLPMDATFADAPAEATPIASQPPPQPVYKCIDCAVMFVNSDKELSTHITAGHRLIYKCNLCEREFEQEGGLKKHLKSHRSVETRKDVWKKCPDCGKCLKLGSMWMHRKIHSDNKKYGCDICGQKFVQKINLTHHSRVHTAEKPYECPECQKRFQERSHLQRHQKYHAQTRSYRCDKCGKMYKTERCLKVHNLVHLEQRPFACNVCDKSFISNSKLKQHSNIHTGERPFKCNYCPRDFTNFPNWLKHTRRRHKVDHKTGEHLENIPSYCSKKSTKTAKEKATKANDTTTTEQNKKTVNTAMSTTTDTRNLAVNTKSSSSTSVSVNVKPQVKRKKKATAPEKAVPTCNSMNVVKNANDAAKIPLVKVMTTDGNNKAPKPTKRERKQLTPKQVQKNPPTLQQPQLDHQPLIIKKEPTEVKTVAAMKPAVDTNRSNAFPDLHCLSITSAEELIMEQALEMEECGLYDAQVSTVDTDNAISSEAAAALHYKIKNEFPLEVIKEEEFIWLKDAKNRVLCSSLESSPFSSPASIEITSTTMTTPGTSSTIPTTTATTTTPTFYLTAPFPMNIQTHNGALVTTASTTPISGNKTVNVLTPTSNMIVTTNVAHTLNASEQNGEPGISPAPVPPAAATTQTLLNHLYLPMTVRMPLLMQPNQMLPSVDTLLFSTQNANAGGYFHQRHHHGKNTTTASARHNLT